MNRSKQKGTAAETAVVTYLRPNGFPHAERRALAGSADLGDILLTAGLIAEVKGGATAETASDTLICTWLDQTERERVNGGAAVAVLVTKRKGKGTKNAGQWWAHMRLSTLARIVGAGEHHWAAFEVGDVPVRMLLADAVALLRANGWGSELEVPAQRGSEVGACLRTS